VGGKWTVLSTPVSQRDPLLNTLRIFPRLHEHRKYCDRRVRVCTAVGRYREGEVLACVAGGLFCNDWGGSSSPKGYSELKEGWRYTWWRSDPLVSHPSLENSSAGTNDGSSRQQLVSDLLYHWVDPRPTSDLPPNPSDSQPAPTLAEIRKAMGPRSTLDASPRGGYLEVPLFSEDISCMYVCAAVWDGCAGKAALPKSIVPSSIASTSSFKWVISQVVGPIEAAPPRAREIWIEGDAKVGSLLIGNVYYYGGIEGESLVSWVAIGEDGEATEVKPAQACPPPSRKPLPSPTDPVGGSGDSHPRALRLTPALKGCLIKFRVQPVRNDGDQGHLESSRPTKEVSA